MRAALSRSTITELIRVSLEGAAEFGQAPTAHRLLDYDADSTPLDLKNRRLALSLHREFISPGHPRINSSARSSKLFGGVMPIRLAVFKLMTN